MSLAGLLIILSSFLLACQDAPTPQGAGFQMPPPAVDVAEVLVEPVASWKTFTGRLEASKTVVVRPRVSGYVQRVAFADGQFVEQGDLLFVIDQAKKIQEVKRLEADLKSANTQIELAQRDLKRAESLREKNAIAQEQFDNIATRLSKAITDAESVEADLGRANIDLGLTEVRAPLTGQVSTADVTEGSYVATGQTELTRMVATKTMYAYFDADEKTYLAYQKNAQGPTPVYMQLIDEQHFPHQGEIDFVDNQLDVATGTIRFRAVFDNRDARYTPGLFARIKMQVGPAQSSVLVDEKAIGTDLNRKFVLVLAEDNTAQYRPVTLGARVGALRVIETGLAAGEKVIVNGLQRVQPGLPVAPTETPMAAEPVLSHVWQTPAPGSANGREPSDDGEAQCG